jgi:tetratricopeptide (TPR) repeat protein
VCAGCLEEGIAFLVLAGGTLAACALGARAGRGAGPGTWLLAAGAAAAPFAVYRLLPYAGLILAAVALRGLGDLASAAPLGAGPRLRPVLAQGAAVLLLAFTAFHAAAGWRFPFGLGVAPVTFPEGAARFILRAGAQGPLFNSLDLGSYLLWALYPRHRVFIHSAIWDSLSDDGLVARTLRSARDPAAFDALAREYRIELLVLPNRYASWGFVAADPRWALIYWDEVASVYARREGANADLIAAREFRETRYSPDLSYLLGAAQDPGRSAAAAGELRRAAREDPENLAARLSLAFLLKARGEDLAEALAAVEAAERRGLRGATLLTWKAEILTGLGRAGEAEAAAQEALRVDPEARTARLVLAGLRARAGDREGAARHLRHLLALPDLPPALRREAEARLRALPPAR